MSSEDWDVSLLVRVLGTVAVLERLYWYRMLTYSRVLIFLSQKMQHISFPKHFRSCDLNKNS